MERVIQSGRRCRFTMFMEDGSELTVEEAVITSIQIDAPTAGYVTANGDVRRYLSTAPDIEFTGVATGQATFSGPGGSGPKESGPVSEMLSRPRRRIVFDEQP